MKTLVIGCGSIGERHIKNLLSLNQEVYVYDKNLERMEKIVKEYKVGVFDFLSHHMQIDAFIICTPPFYHIPFAVEAIKHNAHIFIEKPLSNDMSFVPEFENTLNKTKLVCMIGYQMRFHPKLLEFKNTSFNNDIVSITAWFSKSLADWHIGEDYRRLYTSHENEGGGIILDASHELDYVTWLISKDVKQVSCFCDKLSDLIIDTEDTADILLRFEGGAIANIHLDMVDKIHSRGCKVVRANGHGYEWNISEDTHSWDRLYLDEMKHFIECIEKGIKPTIDLQAGKRVLEIAIAAKESNKTGKVIELRGNNGLG